MVTPERLNKISTVVANRQEGIIVLEDIHDPHNAQAVIRSCDSFGFQTIYMIFQNEKEFNPTRMGKLASSSANKWVDYKIFNSTQECFAELKALGYTSYATVINPQAQSIHETNFANPEEKKLAICFGNEHAGLSKEAQELSDYLLTIPMAGMIQSLNLSVTAAITMFEITRQRKVAGFENFNLHKSAKEKLRETMLSK